MVGGKPVGQHIVLQGGVDYNPGIVAAFQSACGAEKKVRVSPVFSISGAFGAALLAKEAVGSSASTFLGVDFPAQGQKIQVTSEEIRHNRAFYRKAGQLAMEDVDNTIDPKKKTIGVPLTLIMFKFFPMVNAFFRNLGYNVVLSAPSNEETIRLSQQYVQGETCYPVKLIYGHMMQLAQQKVDYIFLPSIHTIRPMPMRRITMPAPICRSIWTMWRAWDREMLASLKPEDKVLVLITRNYGLSDPVLNMGIPEMLLSRGYKVMTLGHLPGMSLDISSDYPNMYWPFGDHLLSGAKLIAHHPNLYAVYLTNHGCGPDTLVSHMFKEEMGDKPYCRSKWTNTIPRWVLSPVSRRF